MIAQEVVVSLSEFIIVIGLVFQTDVPFSVLTFLIVAKITTETSRWLFALYLALTQKINLLRWAKYMA